MTKITVYTQPNCRPCEALKALLTANDVPFEAVDIRVDNDALARLKAEGVTSTPVVEIDGELLYGPSVSAHVVERLDL